MKLANDVPRFVSPISNQVNQQLADQLWLRLYDRLQCEFRRQFYDRVAEQLNEQLSDQLWNQTLVQLKRKEIP